MNDGLGPSIPGGGSSRTKTTGWKNAGCVQKGRENLLLEGRVCVCVCVCVWWAGGEGQGSVLR